MDAGMPSAGTMKMRLPPWAYRSPRRARWMLWPEVVASSLSVNLLSLATPLVVLQVYDRILGEHDEDALRLFCFGASVAVAVAAILRFCRACSMDWAAAAFEHGAGCNAMRQTLAEEASSAQARGLGEHLRRMAAIEEVRDAYSGRDLAIRIDFLFALLFFAILAVLDWRLALIPLALLGLMGALAWRRGRRLESACAERRRIDGERDAFLLQTLSGVHTVKGLGAEALFVRRYERWLGAVSRANYDLAAMGGLASSETVAFSRAMMVAVAAAGAPLALRGDLTLGALAAGVLLAGRIADPTRRRLELWIAQRRAPLAYETLNGLFGQRAASYGAENERTGRVELQGVTCSSSCGRPALDNVSLRLKPGDAVAISGDGGPGLRTLFGVLTGVSLPTQGSVLVDGWPPQAYSSESLAAHLAYLSGESLVLRGTIYDNLSHFGRIPEDRVRELTVLFGLDECLQSLPEGHHTQLEGGAAGAVSRGFRQRIALARSLALKPRIVLLDHAERTLDLEGYNCLYRLLGLLKGRVTLLLATEDQNILRLADAHCRLEQGRLLQANPNEVHHAAAPPGRPSRESRP
jgi:ATP-binding cassette, subfamily C, bacterial LapB